MKNRGNRGILFEAQIRKIRRLHATGQWSKIRLADRYEVCRQTIYKVVSRETYADVR